MQVKCRCRACGAEALRGHNYCPVHLDKCDVWTVSDPAYSDKLQSIYRKFYKDVYAGTALDAYEKCEEGWEIAHRCETPDGVRYCLVKAD